MTIASGAEVFHRMRAKGLAETDKNFFAEAELLLEETRQAQTGTWSRTEFIDGRYGDAIITLTSRRKRWFLFGPIVETVRKYRGSCTVWHHMPSGRRCWTPTEGWLSDIWERATWDEKDKAAKGKDS